MLKARQLKGCVDIFAIVSRQVHQSTTSCATMKYLTQQQKDQYENKGYAIARGVLSNDEIQQARDAIQELIDRARYLKPPAAGEKIVYELGQSHSFNQPMVNRVRFPAAQHATFEDLQRHPKVLDCVEDLIGPSIRFIPQDKLNIKPAKEGDEIPWHQDWAHFPHTNDSVLTACILFYDSTRENGCLEVIPSSHKGPTYSHQDNNNIFTGIITERVINPEEIEYLEGEAGSVTFHNARLIHGSSKNTSTKPRTTLCNIYTAMDAWPLFGVAGKNFSWLNTGPVDYDLFKKTIVRGEPCMRPRMENVPIIIPLPFDEDITVITKEK